MALATSTIALISLGVTAVGAYTAYEGQQQQKEAANRQSAALEGSAAESRAQFASQQRIADIKNARARSDMVRQARVTRGTLANVGANTGVSDSSGVMGGLASVQTQAASNLGIFGAIEQNQEDILSSQSKQAGFTKDAGQAAADASTATVITSLGANIFAAGGGFKTIFDASKKI